MSKDAIGIALLGMGVVGGGVADVVRRKRSHLKEMVGCPIELKGVLVRDVNKPRATEIPRGLITTDVEDILSNPEVDVVVEVMGGQDPRFRLHTEEHIAWEAHRNREQGSHGSAWPRHSDVGAQEGGPDPLRGCGRWRYTDYCATTQRYGCQ